MPNHADIARAERMAQNPVPDVNHMGREEFVREFGKRYQSGQHVLFLGPTQRGKTTLCIQLLSSCISPKRKAVILAGKPGNRDHVMGDAAKNLNLRIVEEFPPGWSYKDRNNNGYVLRPHQTLTDLDADHKNVRAQFKSAMIRNYASQVSVITVVDEGHHVQNDLGLKKELEAPLMRGAPVNSVWLLVQRGRYMTMQAYDAPEHIFIAYDPDLANRKRYSEIGGIDPKTIEQLTAGLKTSTAKTGGTISEFLYIRRSGPQLAIVDVN